MHIFRLAKKIINKSRHRSDAGFTLAEILVAVAIVGILVAVSVPVFSGVMEKANEKADAKVMEAAKAAASAKYLTNQKDITYYYDAATGELVTADKYEDIIPYGKQSSHKNKIICCIIEDKGKVNAFWGKDGINDPEVTKDKMTAPLAMLKELNLSNSPAALPQDGYYSGNTSDKNVQKVQKMLDKYFPTININTWKIAKESATTVLVSDVDLTLNSIKAGYWIRVIRYNTNKKTYTACYMTVSVSSIGYKMITTVAVQGGSPLTEANYSEVPGQTNDSKTNYEETVKIFNNATKVSATKPTA